jgi:hypothetical protein
MTWWQGVLVVIGICIFGCGGILWEWLDRWGRW